MLDIAPERGIDVSSRGNASRFWIVLVASFVLAAQALLTSWAMAASPQGPTLDIFGNPLCITSPDGHGSTPTHDPGKMPTCCTLACGAFVSIIATPTDTVALAHRTASEEQVVPSFDGILASRAEHDPGSPRAPPVLKAG
jgi:hypothetical protein